MAKSSRIHEFYLDIDFWDDHCLLVWPVNKEQAEAWFDKKFPDYEKQDFSALNSCQALSVLGSTCRVIFFREWKNNIDYMGHLAHECVHVSNFILNDKGVREEKGADEAQAYFVSFLFRKLYAALKQKGQTSSKRSER